MRCNAIQSDGMAKKVTKKPPMAFRNAILIALNTPHMTHKQINELRKQQKKMKT